MISMISRSGHMTERSNERKGFQILTVYSKQVQIVIQNININMAFFSSGDLFLLSL